jgi:sarcosine oxidase subunit gamma
MAEATLLRRGPLEGAEDGFRRRSGPALRLEAAPFETQLALRGDAADAGFRDAVAAVLGCALPLQVGEVAGATARLLALGPDEWLVVAPDDARAALLARLEGALVGRHHALVDLSASRAVILIAGPSARALLARGCPLDLHPSVFRAPRCAESLVGRVGVLIEQTDEAPSYRLYVRASLAAFLADWLIDAASTLAGATAPARS